MKEYKDWLNKNEEREGDELWFQPAKMGTPVEDNFLVLYTSKEKIKEETGKARSQGLPKGMYIIGRGGYKGGEWYFVICTKDNIFQVHEGELGEKRSYKKIANGFDRFIRDVFERTLTL